LIPQSTYSKKKSFHLLEETRNLFGNFKGQKWKKLLNISQNGLRFSLPFKKVMPHIEIMKFWQKITVPYFGVSAEYGETLLQPVYTKNHNCMLYSNASFTDN
jgi:hypothetical protein